MAAASVTTRRSTGERFPRKNLCVTGRLPRAEPKAGGRQAGVPGFEAVGRRRCSSTTVVCGYQSHFGRTSRLLPGTRSGWLQSSVHETVDERVRLCLEGGLQVRRRHLEAHDALLRLAVLHVSEPREHRLDLAAGGHEVRLVGEPAAVLLAQPSLLPEVDAVVAAGDRHRCEGFAVEDGPGGR